MSELQSSVYHNCLYHDEFHSYLDVQFEKDLLHFSVSWPVGEPGKMYGIRSESVSIEPDQAIRLAESILEKYKGGDNRKLLREAMNVLRRGQRDEQYELAKRIEDHLGDYAREGWIDLRDKKESEE